VKFSPEGDRPALSLFANPEKGDGRKYRPTVMTPRDPSDDKQSQRVEFTKQMVASLQDMILDLIEAYAEDHPDCDPAAYPVAAGQAFVAQCLKAYGVQGFEAAGQQAKLIIEEMEKAFRESAGDSIA